jgi:two-component system, chemotaxis family, response regulator WspF
MRIAIVNAAPLAVEALRRTISSVPRHQVVWTATDGEAAVSECARAVPDLILMDILMPKMSGTEATRKIMANSPCAILIVTATVEGSLQQVYEALGAGALDAVNTPRLDMSGDATGVTTLISKVDAIERLVQESSPKNRASVPTPAQVVPRVTAPDRLIAIGASAGGPGAIATILGSLPKPLTAAIVIVQHVDGQFAPGLARWLNDQSPVPVRIAVEGERPVAGVVLLAEGDNHLFLGSDQALHYSAEPKDVPYRPSIDVFFESVRKHWKAPVNAVLLTGMGRDGARGLKALRDAGALTLAQDRGSSVVYGMPKAAAELDAATEILPLEQIAARLTSSSPTKTRRVYSGSKP